ncbi:hypothetical protein MRX96_015933 [Rhipicephalus microplus]
MRLPVSGPCHSRRVQSCHTVVPCAPLLQAQAPLESADQQFISTPACPHAFAAPAVSGQTARFAIKAYMLYCLPQPLVPASFIVVYCNDQTRGSRKRRALHVGEIRKAGRAPLRAKEPTWRSEVLRRVRTFTRMR